MAKLHTKKYNQFVCLHNLPLLIIFTHVMRIAMLLLRVARSQSVYLILFIMHNAAKSHLNLSKKYIWTGLENNIAIVSLTGFWK